MTKQGIFLVLASFRVPNELPPHILDRPTPPLNLRTFFHHRVTISGANHFPLPFRTRARRSVLPLSSPTVGLAEDPEVQRTVTEEDPKGLVCSL